MNRQVIPSMLLSVFIVCFFAVVLRPVEPAGGRAVADVAPAPQPTPAPSGSVAEAEPEDAAPSPPVPAAAAGPAHPPVAEAEASPEVVPDVPALVPTTAVVAAPAPVTASAATVAPSAPPEPAPSAPEPAPVIRVAPRDMKPAPATWPDERPEVQIASTPAPRRSPPAPRAAEPEPGPAPAAAEVPATKTKPLRPVEAVAIPRGEPESTVAAEGETLEDVALRVYGTRAAAGTLREANRGLIGRLRAGALLWTPPR